MAGIWNSVRLIKQPCLFTLPSFFALAILSASIGVGGAGSAQAASSEISLWYFTADWCKPCAEMKPTLEQLSAEGWNLDTVDVNARPDLVSRLTIRNLPTLVIMGPRGEIDRIVGVTEYATVRQRVQRAAARFGGPAIARDSRRNPQASPNVLTSPTDLAAGHPRLAASHPSLAASHQSPAAGNTMIVRGQSPGMAATNRMLTKGMVDAVSASGAASTNRRAGGRLTGAAALASHAKTLTPKPTLTPQQAVARAAAATVRIRVDEGNTTAHGTGTIVDVHGQEALVLTCGHLFRDMKPGSVISIDLFAGTSNEINLPSQLIDFKAEEEDIGLITFRLPVRVEPVNLLERGTPLQIGQQVFSFGCDHGNNPTRHDTRITNINRYIGPENIEISGAPAVGRSGGGLFDLNGNLIGVCNAADTNDNEGIYAAADVIYDQINRLGLSHLFLHRANPTGANPTHATPTGATPANFSAVSPAIASNVDADAAVVGAAAHPLATPVPSQDSNATQELICIVKADDGTERVITVHQPSGQLLDQLQAAAGH